MNLLFMARNLLMLMPLSLRLCHSVCATPFVCGELLRVAVKEGFRVEGVPAKPVSEVAVDAG
jgi:hypothetical protein